MEDFLTSERFEQMAREYNAKYRQTTVLKQNVCPAAKEHGALTSDNGARREVAKALDDMLLLLKLCDRKTCGAVRFFSVKTLKQEIENKIHKFAAENKIELQNKQNSTYLWSNDKICVQKFVEIEKFFCKNEKTAKVRCLCDIHEMLLDYLERFFGRM